MNSALWVAVIGGLFSLGTVFATKFLESRSINIAVLAEIKRLLEVIESHKEFWKSCIDSGEKNLPLVSFSTPVFDEQIKSIGTLDGRVVANVVGFYGYVKFINAIQGQREKYPTAANERQFSEQYLQALTRAIDNYRGVFDEAFQRYGLL
jgi:hypothetical protein